MLSLVFPLLGCSAARQPEASKTVSHQAVATFAGGCFWSMEESFESLPGVSEVINGYAGGTAAEPVYKEVAAGCSDFAETVQVYYDPGKISYQKLLETYWMQIDPMDAGGQFDDRGAQYRAIIFYHDGEQQKAAEKTKMLLEKSGYFKAPIVTEIKPLKTFFAAEEAQQNFYIKHSPFYRLYRHDSGRDKSLNQVWGEKQIWKKIKKGAKNAR